MADAAEQIRAAIDEAVDRANKPVPGYGSISVVANVLIAAQKAGLIAMYDALLAEARRGTGELPGDAEFEAWYGNSPNVSADLWRHGAKGTARAGWDAHAAAVKARGGER